MKSIETSASFPLKVDFLTRDLLKQPGRIGMTIAPGKHDEEADIVWKRNLKTDLTRLHEHYGIDRLVCLLEGEELHHLGIPNLLTAASAHGMVTEHLPIPDDGLPDSMTAFSALVDQLLNAVSTGESVLIHCNGGRGRTGMLAACCLVGLGYFPEDAIVKIQQARTGALSVAIKRDYVHRFYQARADQ